MENTTGCRLRLTDPIVIPMAKRKTGMTGGYADPVHQLVDNHAAGERKAKREAEKDRRKRNRARNAKRRASTLRKKGDK